LGFLSNLLCCCCHFRGRKGISQYQRTFYTMQNFISINKSDNTPKIPESSHLNRQKFCVCWPNPAIKEVSDNVDNNIMI
jgi:hypothetical protein